MPLRKLFSASQQIKPRGADIFELEGDHIHRGGERAQRIGILVVAERDAGRNLRRRTVRLWREDMAAVAQPRGRHRGHPAELAAADNPDRGIGR
jgi:hypothetical protein